jgi:aminoglycoside 2''-phosphotransferase
MASDGTLLQRIARALAHLDIQDYAVRATAHGQNNDIVTIQATGDELVFRFPRHPRAIEDLAREMMVLRALHGRLPLPIPQPVATSLDPPEPGGVFIGYWKLPGVPLTGELFQSLPSEEAQQAIANQLGAFLTALHAIPLATFDPPLAASDRATWEQMYSDVRTRLFRFMRPDARQQISAHFEMFLDDAASSAWEPTPIHGDFGTGNILYDPNAGMLSGVIDWSSAGLGDPAVDLAALIAPVSLGSDFAELLASSYPALASELPHAHFYVGTFALQEALFGLETGDSEAFEAGIASYR